MPMDLPPNLANTAASATVRHAEKQNNTPRDHGKSEREAEAKRQRSGRQEPKTSGR